MLIALSLACATACSSRAGTVTPPVAASGAGVAATASGSRATLSVKVPVKTTTTSATSRRPAYVSPSSANLLVAVNGGTATTYGLTQQSPGCAPVSGYVQCTFTVAAPAGTDAFALSVTDAAGAVLSRNVVTATLAPGKATPIPVTLSGTPVSAAILPATTAIEGSAAPFHFPGLFPAAVEAVALDADGNFILGPGAPTLSSPLTVSTGSGYATVTKPQDGDPNSFLLQPVDGNSEGQTVTVSATFTGVPLNDGTTSPTVTGTTSYTFTPAYVVAGGPFFVTFSAESLKPISVVKFCQQCVLSTATDIAIDAKGTTYITYHIVGGGFGTGSYEVAVFPPGAVVPSTVFDISKGVHNVSGVAVDKNGTLYIANGSGGFRGPQASIMEFALGTTTPAVTITGTPNTPGGIAVDANGYLYVSDAGNGNIAIYPPNATTPSTTLSDPQLPQPGMLAVDSAGGVYALDQQNFGMVYFAPGAATSTTPTTSASAYPASGFPGQGKLMFDPAGNLWYSSAVLGASKRIPAADLPNNVNYDEQFAFGGFIGYLR